MRAGSGISRRNRRSARRSPAPCIARSGRAGLAGFASVIEHCESERAGRPERVKGGVKQMTQMKEMSVATRSETDRPADLLGQYGCGPVQFSGSADGLY